MTHKNKHCTIYRQPEKQYWPPTTNSKLIVVNVTKQRRTTYKVHVQAKQGANK